MVPLCPILTPAYKMVTINLLPSHQSELCRDLRGKNMLFNLKVHATLLVALLGSSVFAQNVQPILFLVDGRKSLHQMVHPGSKQVPRPRKAAAK